MAAYVETDRRYATPQRTRRTDENPILETNISLATAVGATVVRIHAPDEAAGLLALADREGVTHAVFGYVGERERVLDPDSIIGVFVRRCRGVEVEVVQSQEQPGVIARQVGR
jgi:K+-sensing histidine kinase KdpD